MYKAICIWSTCCRYVGIVDNCCYDLRLGCRIESKHMWFLKQWILIHYVDAIMMSKGINQCMKHVNHVDTIWSRVKEGTLVPFVLKIRLTDEAQFMGHLTIVDLLQPEFQRPPMLRPAASIYCSFEQLSKSFLYAKLLIADMYLRIQDPLLSLWQPRSLQRPCPISTITCLPNCFWNTFADWVKLWFMRIIM